jgi:hypothetical protein
MEGIVPLTHFWAEYYMQVSGHFYAPVALLP